MIKQTFIFLMFVFILPEAYAQPSNDNPCTAIALTINTNVNNSCIPTNVQTWTGATVSAGYAAPFCGIGTVATNIPDVWYSFTPLISGNVVINTAAGTGTGAITDAAMAVYHSTSCAVPAQFALDACNDDSAGITLMPFINMPVIALTTYYIRLWPYYGAVSGNIGGICVSAAPPPIDPSKKVGIGTEVPQANLDVNGNVIIRSGSPGIGKVLTSTDANGTLAWQPLTTLPSGNSGTGFKAGNNAGGIIPAPPCGGCVGLAVINWPDEEYDDASSIAGTTFTAASAGLYHFDAQVTFAITGVSSAAGQVVGINLLINGINHIAYTPVSSINNGTSLAAKISIDAKLLAGQTASVQGYNITSVPLSFQANEALYKYYSFFSGHKVY